MLVARSLALVLLICLAASLAAQETPEVPSPEDIAPVLFATGLAPARSLTFDQECNAYLANYRRPGVVGRVLEDGTASVLCDLLEAAPQENRTALIACLRVDVEGRIIVADAGGGRLLRISHDGARVEVLADRHEGERFTAIEAVALDRFGDIYFTDRGAAAEEDSTEEDSETRAANPTPAEPPATGVLYRFDIQTGKVTLLERGFMRPAGLAVSPDQTQLVMAEAAADRVLVYQLGPQGELSDRRVLHTWSPAREDGEEAAAEPPANYSPGGLAFDAQGLLYVALAGTGSIEALHMAEGDIAATYDAGGIGASDCHFHAGDLYIAVAPKEAVFRLPLAIDGFDYCGQ